MRSRTTRHTTSTSESSDSGILLLDKPRRLVVKRRPTENPAAARADKAGHVGSLDPLATGMLPICLGEATKIAGDILSGRKLYRFTVALGSRTATGDIEGAVVETAPVPEFDADHLQQVLRQFHGRQTQIPPMYSALKRDGQPLYKLARAGIEVERAAREHRNLHAHLCGHGPIASSSWRCSVPRGPMSEPWRRTSPKPWGPAATFRPYGGCASSRLTRRLWRPWNRSPSAVESGRPPTLLPADAPLQHLPAVALDSKATEKILHGQSVTVTTSAAGRVRLYDAADAFIGMGESDGSGNVRPKRLFNDAP